MALPAWSLELGACALQPEAGSFYLFAVDRDPGTEALPAVGHDLEIKRYGC